MAQPEVVDPDRLGAGRAHLVRALVDDVDAHVLQERQDVGEGDDWPCRKSLNRSVPAAASRSVQVHPEVVATAERLHPPDVDDGRGGGVSCW